MNVQNFRYIKCVANWTHLALHPFISFIIAKQALCRVFLFSFPLGSSRGVALLHMHAASSSGDSGKPVSRQAYNTWSPSGRFKS